MSKPTSSNEQPADTQQTEVPSEKEQCRRLFEIEIEAKFDEKKNTIIEKQKQLEIIAEIKATEAANPNRRQWYSGI